MQYLPLESCDDPLVWEFLCLAAHETELAVIQNAPALAHYASGWGREGDFGFKAVQEGQIVGVVWARLFPEADKGFGWVSAHIPEISLAVREEFRGRGVGHALLEKMVGTARERFEGLSLNVREENIAAVRLYVSCGFERVAASERINRTGRVSFNMWLDFSRN